jgi:transglutaminase-like putative cysteine protease
VTTAHYRVAHETRYRYGETVTTSQHVAYLRPRSLPYQDVARSALDVDPLPARVTRRIDYFGNEVDHLSILRPHTELSVVGRSLVAVTAPEEPRDLEASPPWEQVRESLLYRKGAPSEEAAQFAYASPHAPREPELAEFARASFPAGRPFAAAAADLMQRIHREFRFDPRATTVATPLKRVLAKRRGVCQDFAHLQIASLRSLGLPARYVSGYLLTDPPAGRERLVGADASHAWVSVACPLLGWLDLDPTNGVLPSDGHVTVAWGRDFGDVSPLRGVILGGAEHELDVGVDVTPLGEREWGEAVRASA